MLAPADMKAHLALPDSDTGDDALIQGMIDAAVDHLQSIGVKMSTDPLPPALHHAVQMLVAHFYANREAVADNQGHLVPLGIARLIAPYRSLDL